MYTVVRRGRAGRRTLIQHQVDADQFVRSLSCTMLLQCETNNMIRLRADRGKAALWFNFCASEVIPGRRFSPDRYCTPNMAMLGVHSRQLLPGVAHETTHLAYETESGQMHGASSISESIKCL